MVVMLDLGFSEDSTYSLVGPAMLGSGYVWQQNLELRERKEKEHLREKKEREREHLSDRKRESEKPMGFGNFWFWK